MLFLYLQKSSGISDCKVEAQPLWEYPGNAISDVVEICTLDVESNQKDIISNGIFELKM